MSDYDIRPKPKVWASSPNECRTFGRMLCARMKQQILCSLFASHSRFVTVFSVSVCKVSLQSFDITPPKSFLSIIIIIITSFTGERTERLENVVVSKHANKHVSSEMAN